jgi:hypothetical protein
LPKKINTNALIAATTMNAMTLLRANLETSEYISKFGSSFEALKILTSPHLGQATKFFLVYR